MISRFDAQKQGATLINRRSAADNTLEIRASSPQASRRRVLSSIKGNQSNWIRVSNRARTEMPSAKYTNSYLSLERALSRFHSLCVAVVHGGSLHNCVGILRRIIRSCAIFKFESCESLLRPIQRYDIYIRRNSCRSCIRGIVRK